jgi:hypothetical protein
MSEKMVESDFFEALGFFHSRILFAVLFFRPRKEM